MTVNTLGVSGKAGTAGGPGNAALGSFTRLRVNPLAGGAIPGFEGVNGGDTNGLGNRDTYNDKFFDKSLISPTTDYTGYGQATYDLHALGGAQLYADVLYTRRQSSQRQFSQLIIDYPVGSPLIPAVLAYSNQAPSDQTNGKRLGVRVFTSRNSEASQRVEYTRVGGGIRGSLPFSDWTYDLYAGHSYTNGKYYLVQPITSRFLQSQDVVASGSGFVCRDTSNGCVALPALTSGLINGDIPSDYLAFIAPRTQGLTKFFETTFSASATGTLVTLPAGKVGLALGAEYRKQRIDDQPPVEQQTGQLYSYSTAGITQGSDNVKEVFAELEVPLLANKPFFNELTINGSGRYTDYRSYGSGWDLQDWRCVVADPGGFVPRHLWHVVSRAFAVRTVPGADRGLHLAEQRSLLPVRRWHPGHDDLQELPRGWRAGRFRSRRCLTSRPVCSRSEHRRCRYRPCR